VINELSGVLYMHIDDGTLTPIVSNPSDAKITAEMTAIVDRLSHRHSTAIVTGRAINTIGIHAHVIGCIFGYFDVPVDNNS
jgi:hypothetical protein